MTTLDHLRRRYVAAAHAVQAGTKIVNAETDAMDCRIGLNVQMAEFGGLCELLVSKGVFTEDEMMDAITAGLLREKERLEHEIAGAGGAKVTLV